MTAPWSSTPRFLLSLVPPTVLLFSWIALVTFLTSRLGLVVGLVAGSSMILGLLVAYWTAADALNLRVLRRSGQEATFRDGEVVAVDGVARVDGTPLQAPLTQQACAAYSYVISGSRPSRPGSGSRRLVIAEGFHMRPTRIDTGNLSLRLWCFPGFEDDLRETVTGRQIRDRATALQTERGTTARSAGERERRSALLTARREAAEQVGCDFWMGQITGTGDGLTFVEEVLPANQPVCVIGTFDAERNGLTARTSRLGHNLIVYHGTRSEVLTRVGKDTAIFTKVASVLIAIGGLAIALALLPPN